MSSAIDRAQSYFLVCGVTSKTIAYIVGPKMLHDNSEDLDIPDEQHSTPSVLEDDEHLNEQTSLLPRRAQRTRKSAANRIRQRAILGLVPSLHRAFFFHQEDGGIFNAWLTASVRNIGRLFTTLQILMVGCKLGVTFERMVAEGNSGRIPVKAITTIFVVRLLVWPALSISLIYGLAKRTRLLGDDLMLWFSMMLMPAGPPALVISGLAELAKASEVEKMVIAKTLTIIYALSPFVCFSITGALKASESVMERLDDVYAL